MQHVISAALVLILLLKNCGVGKVRGKLNPTTIPDEIYECMVKIAKGTTLPPVKERTNAEKSAYVRYWRAKGKTTVQKENEKDVFFFFPLFIKIL